VYHFIKNRKEKNCFKTINDMTFIYYILKEVMRNLIKFIILLVLTCD